MVDVAVIEERIGKCRKILDVDPNSQIFAALAESYRKKGELDKAFRTCQSGLRIHPNYGSAHMVMSKINLDRGMYDWAEAEAKLAADLDGRTRAYELLLSEVYIYQGHFRNALELLEGLHETDPENSKVNRLIEMAKSLPQEQVTMMTPSESVDEAVYVNPVVESVVETGSAKLAGAEVLKRAIGIAGVDGALFINSEGLVVDKQWKLAMDPMVCGATIGETGSDLSKQLMENSLGCIRTLLIETTGPVFYLVRVEDGTFVFVSGNDVNLGGMRMKIESLLERYQ